MWLTHVMPQRLVSNFFLSCMALVSIGSLHSSVALGHSLGFPWPDGVCLWQASACHPMSTWIHSWAIFSHLLDGFLDSLVSRTGIWAFKLSQPWFSHKALYWKQSGGWEVVLLVQVACLHLMARWPGCFAWWPCRLRWPGCFGWWPCGVQGLFWQHFWYWWFFRPAVQRPDPRRPAS